MFNFGPSVPTISVEEIKKSIDEKNTFFLLDVRTPGEFKTAKIHGSVNIPLDEIDEKIEKVIPDKNIYSVCVLLERITKQYCSSDNGKTRI